jgi:hypothetical protein
LEGVLRNDVSYRPRSLDFISPSRWNENARLTAALTAANEDAENWREYVRLTQTGDADDDV